VRQAVLRACVSRDYEDEAGVEASVFAEALLREPNVVGVHFVPGGADDEKLWSDVEALTK